MGFEGLCEKIHSHEFISAGEGSHEQPLLLLYSGSWPPVLLPVAMTFLGLRTGGLVYTPASQIIVRNLTQKGATNSSVITQWNVLYNQFNEAFNKALWSWLVVRVVCSQPLLVVSVGMEAVQSQIWDFLRYGNSLMTKNNIWHAIPKIKQAHDLIINVKILVQISLYSVPLDKIMHIKLVRSFPE